MSVSIKGASFSYERNRVLEGIDVNIGEGETVFIVGPNGAGKSTLLRLIAGLAQPKVGRVRCFGVDPYAAPRSQTAKHLAFLPQSYDLTFPFTVADIVLLGRYAHGRSGLAGFYTRNEDRTRAKEAMRRCDIEDLENRRWDQLSGGEQRRVLLAQAFCQDTPLLLLDEPTSSLDPAHAVEIFEALGERPKSSTAIVVSHDLNLALRYADRLLLLSHGRLVADGTPGEVLRSKAASRAFSIEFHIGSLPGTETPFVVPR